MFLGTSSMKPGIYRNVSSIYVKLAEKFNNYGLLLDCGEGSYQQIYDYFGKEKTDQIMDNMKIIFLTHKHGDHMLGALKVIFEIEKLKRLKKNINYEDDKVYIIAPKTLLKWIKNNLNNENNFIEKDLFIFIDNRELNLNMESIYDNYIRQNNPYLNFKDSENNASEEFLNEKMKNYFDFIYEISKENKSKNSSENELINSVISDDSLEILPRYNAKENSNIDLLNNINNNNHYYKSNSLNKSYFNKKEVLKIIEFHEYTKKKMGINFFSIEVFHCDESFGCFLEHIEIDDNNKERKRLWKISYSGDTRPCINFSNFAAFSTLFIHEATFDDELNQDAINKLHSTMAESILLGKESKSWRVALTHFSPRYNKELPYKNEYLDDKAVFVNDYFYLKLSEFNDAYLSGKKLANLLEEANKREIL
jgi:ribonuclease Z